MTIEELEVLLRNTSWFEHLTEPIGDDHKIERLGSLAPWGILPTDGDHLEEITDLAE